MIQPLQTRFRELSGGTFAGNDVATKRTDHWREEKHPRG
jgi:hypothetical protein